MNHKVSLRREGYLWLKILEQRNIVLRLFLKFDEKLTRNMYMLQ